MLSSAAGFPLHNTLGVFLSDLSASVIRELCAHCHMWWSHTYMCLLQQVILWCRNRGFDALRCLL